MGSTPSQRSLPKAKTRGAVPRIRGIWPLSAGSSMVLVTRPGLTSSMFPLGSVTLAWATLGALPIMRTEAASQSSRFSSMASWACEATDDTWLTRRCLAWSRRSALKPDQQQRKKTNGERLQQYQPQEHFPTNGARPPAHLDNLDSGGDLGSVYPSAAGFGC